MPSARSFDSNSTSTTLKETRIDNRIERSNSLSSKQYHKLPLLRQDSVDPVPDLSNNNQDVSILFEIPTSIHTRLKKKLPPFYVQIFL